MTLLSRDRRAEVRLLGALDGRARRRVDGPGGLALVSRAAEPHQPCHHSDRHVVPRNAKLEHPLHTSPPGAIRSLSRPARSARHRTQGFMAFAFEPNLWRAGRTVNTTFGISHPSIGRACRTTE